MPPPPPPSFDLNCQTTPPPPFYFYLPLPDKEHLDFNLNIRKQLYVHPTLLLLSTDIETDRPTTRQTDIRKEDTSNYYK